MRHKFYLVSLTLFIVSVLITALLSVAFWPAYYESTYERLDTAETIGISADDLDTATDVLLGYITGDVESLDLEVVVDGQSVQMFNQREKDHMVDVKTLYDVAVAVRNVGFSLMLIAAYLGYRTKDYQDRILHYRNLRRALVVLAVVFGTVAVAAFIDFDTFWIVFHKAVFTNDLWLLNPQTDRLIMMVPQAFFMGLVYRIIAAFAAVFGVFLLGCRWLGRQL